MRKISLFSDIKIRSSLILVLVFFLLMLVAGAALGILSLRDSNQTLNNIVRTQRLGANLGTAIDGYKNVQTGLGRAVASFVVDSGQQNYAAANEWNTGGAAGAAALNDEVRGYIDASRKEYDRSMQHFKVFQDLAQGVPDPENHYKRVIDGYTALMKSGVMPLFGMMSAGDIRQYDSFLDKTTLSLEHAFYDSLDGLRAFQQRVIDRSYQAEAEHYELVIMLVAGAMLLCVLIAFLTYVFLGRVVLHPLHLAGMHFDRIAGGDLTQRVELRSHNEIGVLYEALRRMQESLTRTVSTVRQGVEEITLGSREIFMGNTDLSSRTEQQAASLQETAASMEQLASTVRQNTDNATQADTLAKSASEVAARGGQAVSAVVDT
ncbi:MAG: Tar ligand binding domain-containing protein, partial [Burkholderiaceae bacterium]